MLRKEIFTEIYTPFNMRDDIIEAHHEVWNHIAQASTWFTGAERVAIAKATRSALTCQLCADRKQALSPYYVDGTHDIDTDIDPIWLDTVHRIVTDPARLSKRVYDDFIASGMTDAHYVELLSVLLFMLSIEMFHRAIGAQPLPFPEPQAGEPTQERPDSVEIGAWIPMQSLMSKFVREFFAGTGPVTNVVRALSLVPDATRNQMKLVNAQYLPLKQVASTSAGNRTITRPQIELIASRVSALNECFY